MRKSIVKKKKNSSDSSKILNKLKSQDNESLSILSSISPKEVEIASGILKERCIPFVVINSNENIYIRNMEQIKNKKSPIYKNKEMQSIICNSNYKELLIEIKDEIEKGRMSTDEDFKNKDIDENKILEYEELYQKKYKEAMILESQVKMNSQLQAKKTDSFRENYYISYIPFYIYSYLDQELFKGLTEFGAQYIGNSTVAAYYLIQDRNKFKNILSIELDSEQIMRLPLKARGVSFNIDAMQKYVEENKKGLRNIEIVGLESFEKNVEILVDYGIDFNANSIGDNSFLILFDDVSFIENIDDIKRRQEICS